MDRYPFTAAIVAAGDVEAASPEEADRIIDGVLANASLIRIVEGDEDDPTDELRARPVSVSRRDAAAAAADFDDWTPPGLYNDRMHGCDQIDLEEMVSRMIASARDDAGRITDDRQAELGRRITLILLYQTRPDLFRDGQVDITKLLAVRQPNARTAVVEIEFSEGVTSDLQLAENIADALAHECRSGNGLMHEAGEGFTQSIRVCALHKVFNKKVRIRTSTTAYGTPG